MLRLVRYLFWLFARFVVSLRYRVRITGMERLPNLRGPILILPNHPAYMDPVVVLTMLWGTLRPRPMISRQQLRQSPALPGHEDAERPGGPGSRAGQVGGHEAPEPRRRCRT